MFDGVMNVGMKVDATGYVWEMADVLDAAERCGVIIVGKPSVVNSDSEPTVVAAFAAPTSAEVWDMAKMLQQDCIATYNARTWRGRLIGPNAEAWGDFNPHMFFTSTGKRLGDIIDGAQG